jgi:hypothetical protein
LDRGSNGVQHVIGFDQHAFVRKAQDPNPDAAKIASSFGVVFGLLSPAMIVSVYLDRQASLVAVEVKNVRAYWMLTAKL